MNQRLVGVVENGFNLLTFGSKGMEEWGTIITTITTILPFPTNQR